MYNMHVIHGLHVPSPCYTRRSATVEIARNAPVFQVELEKTAGSIVGHALVSVCPEH